MVRRMGGNAMRVEAWPPPETGRGIAGMAVRPVPRREDAGESRAAGAADAALGERAAYGERRPVIEAFDRRFRFHIDEETGRVQVDIIDRATGEVLDRIPPEELLKLAAEIKRMVGLMLDRKV